MFLVTDCGRSTSNWTSRRSAKTLAAVIAKCHSRTDPGRFPSQRCRLTSAAGHLGGSNRVAWVEGGDHNRIDVASWDR